MKTQSAHLFCSLLFTLFLTAGILAGNPCRAEAPSLAGTYRCEGESGGSAYRGTCKISRDGEAYRLKWSIGGSAQTGIGLVEGGALAVAYQGSISGVVVYRIDGERLVGRWTTFDGHGVVATETLTLQRDPRLGGLPD